MIDNNNQYFPGKWSRCGSSPGLRRAEAVVDGGLGGRRRRRVTTMAGVGRARRGRGRWLSATLANGEPSEQRP